MKRPSPNPIKVALTIAGSDSSGGAGIQADLKTFQALGVFGTSAVTAVTVQNTQKVYAVQEVDPRIVHDQIICLFEDMAIHAVKIGMVSSIPIIRAIAEALQKVDCPAVVLDPVMSATSGYALLKKAARQELVSRLVPLAEVVTPNIAEAEILTGLTIIDQVQMEKAARQILGLGAKKVVVKGGHMQGKMATDILYDGHTVKYLGTPRSGTPTPHGTGCTFSAAIAAYLARGLGFFEAVERAKAYISGAIANALEIGKGPGPTHHFYDLYERSGIFK